MCGPAARLSHPPDVLDTEPASAVVYQADHVDADLVEPDSMGVQPLHREPAQPRPLGPADGLQPAAVLRPAPGLDLDDHDRVPLGGHDLALAHRAAPVACHNPH